MNFLGATGLEMIGIQSPTLIEDHMNVVSESFSDYDDAKTVLRDFSNQERMLPGAAIRAANFADSKGGVCNALQEGVNTDNYDGHIEWLRKYSFFDSISSLVMLVVASYLGWTFETGVFHFLMAITILTRINEEVSIFGTCYVLFGGTKYGYKMHEDSFAQFLVPASLGSVEAVYELIQDEERLWIARCTLVIAGVIAGGIIFSTLLARLMYRDSRGDTYEEVLQRDGSIECLLTGEKETGFRSIDHPQSPGVGPLQAQLYNLCEYNPGGVSSSTATAPHHVSGGWIIAGTLHFETNLDGEEEEEDTGDSMRAKRACCQEERFGLKESRFSQTSSSELTHATIRSSFRSLAFLGRGEEVSPGFIRQRKGTSMLPSPHFVFRFSGQSQRPLYLRVKDTDLV